MLVMYGHLTDRGILFISRIHNFPIVWGLPFILMYGIGGALMIWCFKPLSSKPVLLFFVCLVSMTAFEYLTSFTVELIWNELLWDYSHKFMNFQGRICLSIAITWGVLGVVSVKFLGPLFHRWYSNVKHVKTLHIIILLLVVYIAVCYSLRSVLFPELVAHLQVN